MTVTRDRFDAMCSRAMHSRLIERSHDSVSSPMMLIVLQVDVQESISRSHAKAVMSRTACQSQRGGVGRSSGGQIETRRKIGPPHCNLAPG